MMAYSKYNSRKSGREKRKAKPFQTRRSGILVLIVTTSFLLVLKVATWLNAQELFSQKDIKIEGNHLVKKSELLALVKVTPSASLLEFDTQKIAAQVEQHPLIQTASVSRNLPSRLVIRVREKEPIAILNSSELLALDEKGHPMPVHRNEMFFDYPIVSNLEMSKTNAETNSELGQIIEFLTLIKAQHFTLYSEISEISYSRNSGIYFYLNENLTPVIWGNGDSQGKGTNLIQILAHLKSKNKLSQVKYFDLRFKNQVIVKEFLKS